MSGADPLLPARTEPAGLPAFLASGQRHLLERGYNRCPGTGLLRSTDDPGAVSEWVDQFSESPHTRASYEKESRRLLLWAACQIHKPLSALTVEDMKAYRSFLSDPQPRALWVAAGRAPVGSAAWRPFAGPLKPPSVDLAMTILASMFNWLVQAGYLSANPLAILRGGKRARPDPAAQMDVHRTISTGAWHTIMRQVREMPPTARSVRYRWVVSVLWLGLRISEACSARMGDVFARDGAWWLSVVGKGGKRRAIPLTAEWLDELATYRRWLGLAPRPQPGEACPLICRLCPRHSELDSAPDCHLPVSRSALHDVVKGLFDQVAGVLQQQGELQQAALLRMASAHWVRHTTASQMVNDEGMSLTSVRDILGHASLTTTNIYLHAPLDALHDEAKRRRRIGWADCDPSLPSAPADPGN